MVSNPTKALLTEYACSGPANGRLLLVVVVWDVGLDGADHKGDCRSDGLLLLCAVYNFFKHVEENHAGRDCRRLDSGDFCDSMHPLSEVISSIQTSMISCRRPSCWQVSRLSKRRRTHSRTCRPSTSQSAQWNAEKRWPSSRAARAHSAGYGCPSGADAGVFHNARNNRRFSWYG